MNILTKNNIICEIRPHFFCWNNMKNMFFCQKSTPPFNLIFFYKPFPLQDLSVLGGQMDCIFIKGIVLKYFPLHQFLSLIFWCSRTSGKTSVLLDMEYRKQMGNINIWIEKDLYVHKIMILVLWLEICVSTHLRNVTNYESLDAFTSAEVSSR